MTKMRTTCSNKKEGENEKFLPSLFIISLRQNDLLNISKTEVKYQNVGQMLPKLGIKTQEKTLTTCFISY